MEIAMTVGATKIQILHQSCVAYSLDDSSKEEMAIAAETLTEEAPCLS